ncbi:hypothetical protein SAMN02990966_05508 [Rhodospirillales bacterium URHD0017]|nr:hypothetical protein SAMN02990966_05508 [Rhodospirillales bacterium URHD0017]
MKKSIKYVVAALAVALPVMAAAQTKMSDADYCKALSDKYQTYVSNMQSGRSPMPESPDIRVAMDRCEKGDTAAGIPVLEQKLRNARIDLPSRG